MTPLARPADRFHRSALLATVITTVPAVVVGTALLLLA